MRHTTLQHVALGAAAGLAGTFVMHGLLAAHKRLSPRTMPPMRKDPGEFMVRQAERSLPTRIKRSIPDAAETAAATGLSLGYGATFGALYAALRSRGGSAWTDGPVLGILTWAAGYLGWLPASGLMPPPWKQDAARATIPIAEHALFGIATVAAYDAMHHYFASGSSHKHAQTPASEVLRRPGSTIRRLREALHV
jgi:hypothetical protein